MATLYAFLRKQFVPKAPNILSTHTRPLNDIKLIQESKRKHDGIGSVDVNVLKLVKEEVEKAEMKILDMMARQLDVINNRMNYNKMYL